jgi:hypothetical protein
MSELKVRDRVRIVSVSRLGNICGTKIRNGMKGTVKSLSEDIVGVEFDKDIGGHTGSWNGKNGHCWYVAYKRLEKIDVVSMGETKEEVEEMKKEVNEETKSETMEQKILEVLREEIGVDIGEEFDVYENGEKQWTCKFDEVGFSHEIDDEFRESGFWKQIVCKFHSYQFKKKPFIPKCGEEYFFLTIDDDDNENILLDVAINTWIGVETDYGRLALGNVFRTKEEALKYEDELLKKLERLRKGEI